MLWFGCEKKPGQKTITKAAYTEAIMQHFFPQEPWGIQQQLQHEWLAGPTMGHESAALGDFAMELLDEANQT